MGQSAAEIADCQRLDWKATHKHECARFKAEADAAKEAKETDEKAAGAAGGGRRDGAGERERWVGPRRRPGLLVPHWGPPADT